VFSGLAEILKATPLVGLVVLFVLIVSGLSKKFVKFMDRVLESRAKEVEELREDINGVTESTNELINNIETLKTENKGDIRKIYNQIDSLRASLDNINNRLERLSKDK
jgi:uncharacterized protein YoxC